MVVRRAHSAAAARPAPTAQPAPHRPSSSTAGPAARHVAAPARNVPIHAWVGPPAVGPLPRRGRSETLPGRAPAAPSLRAAGPVAPRSAARGGSAAPATGSGLVAPRPGAPIPPSPVPLRIPPPPTTLTPPARARLARAEERIGQAAAANATLPPAAENVGSARAAVEEPAPETHARSEQSVVTALDDRPAPSPEIERLCDRMRQIIRDHRPADEESLVEARPDDMAREAGGQVSGAVEGDAQRVAGQYDSMSNPPAGTPASTAQDLPAPPGAPPPVDAQAGAATPDAVPAANVSLAADVADSQSQMDRAGMNSPAAQLVQNGPIAEARQAQGELQQAAQRSPAQIMAEQRAAIARASRDMSDLQATARRALASARTTTVGGTTAQQRGMVRNEGDMRTRVAQQAQTIFDAAQRDVEQLLQPLPQTALGRWEAGVNEISQQFKDRLARVKRWIDDRHSGVGGFFVGLADAVTGLPDWVTEEYDAAEALFADRTCNLIRDISRDVNAVIAACEGIIQSARQRIQRLYGSLPAELQQWAQQQQQQFATRLDGLSRQATQARNSVNSDLTQRASQAVQEVREQIQTLRTEAGGIVGRIRNAIGRFLDNPGLFIINGLLDLLGIPHAAFWQCVDRIRSVINQIADDPLRFASALLRGIGRGFSLFFDHFPQHLAQGFLNWLFGALPPGSGPTIPRDLSLRSIITFFLEIMGITWPRIRRILVELVGERAVGIAERVWGMLSTLIQMGPRGVWEMIKDRLNPQSIIDMVIDAAVRYMVEAIVTRVAARILLLFNPVGAIVQAIEAIYRVLSWVFRNAARIFRLIEAVVNGVYDMLAGRDQAVAQAVERALAMLIPPVIDFLADYLGFGGLPARVAQLVGQLQGWVERTILRPVLTFLVEQGRRLLAAVGIQTQRPGARPGDEAVGRTVSFSGGEESHRLYVQVQGNDGELMVASRPMTVTQRLNWFESRVGDSSSPSGRRRGRRSGRLGGSRTTHGTTPTRWSELIGPRRRRRQTRKRHRPSPIWSHSSSRRKSS